MTTPTVKERSIYISGPYTDGDVVLNLREAAKVCDVLRAKGWLPVSPILITHMWHFLIPHQYEYWLQYDLGLLALCSSWVRGYGYDRPSPGSDREREQAKALAMTVYDRLGLVPDLRV